MTRTIASTTAETYDDVDAELDEAAAVTEEQPVRKLTEDAFAEAVRAAFAA